MAPRSPSSFFKILLDPSAPHLQLPPTFVSRHLENRIPKDPIIRTAIGGYSWRLKIKKIGEIYCFANGWNNVVQDIRLGFGDLLVFRLLDQSTFKMLIYSPNGCERNFPPKIKHDGGGVDDDGEFEDVVDEDDENDDEEEEKEDGDDDYHDDDEGNGDDENDEENADDDGDPFFTSIITKTHRSMLRFPAEFVGWAGIDPEGTITLKNLDGEEWQMALRLDKSYRTKRYLLSSGWPDFRRNNDLSEGDECVFKFIRSERTLLLEKVTKKKWPERQPQPSGEIPAIEVVKRERGRPAGEHCGDVDVESEDEFVEVMKTPCGMPPKRSCGTPPKRSCGTPPEQKSSVVYF